jgi:hypothetical protein
MVVHVYGSSSTACLDPVSLSWRLWALRWYAHGPFSSSQCACMAPCAVDVHLECASLVERSCAFSVWTLLDVALHPSPTHLHLLTVTTPHDYQRANEHTNSHNHHHVSIHACRSSSRSQAAKRMRLRRRPPATSSLYVFVVHTAVSRSSPLLSLLCDTADPCVLFSIDVTHTYSLTHCACHTLVHCLTTCHLCHTHNLYILSISVYLSAHISLNQP